MSCAKKGAEVYGKPHKYSDGLSALKNASIPCDVFVEATNSHRRRARLLHLSGNPTQCSVCANECRSRRLLLGYLLRTAPQSKMSSSQVTLSDRHGVLARMIEEIEMWAST